MNTSSVTTLTRGKFAEDLAFNYLLQQGLKPLARNYRRPCGEIDIIMQHDETIVFIEVRYRKNSYYLAPIETVTTQKCNHIIATSQIFLQSNRSAAKMSCRFDVVTLTGIRPEQNIEWIKNAFQA